MRINCHCHIFSLDDVPDRLKERLYLDLSNPLHRMVHLVLRAFLPRESKPEEWLDFARLSVREIGWRLVAEMDEAGIELATPLMMDMAYCEGFAGGTKDFQAQVDETLEVVEEIRQACGRTRLLPFVAADPRRPGVVPLVIRALEGGGFKGVKIYPVMGFYPYDERLTPLYEFCQDRGIPLTAHCFHGGIPLLDRTYHMADPAHWLPVLEQFPTLRLNLAHNDRLGTPWQERIRALIMEHPHVYTDVSFNAEMLYRPRRYFRFIQAWLRTPVLRERLLYGTDWYMGRFLWTERSYLRWFEQYAARIPWCRVRFTTEELRLLTEENPLRFLGLSSWEEAGREGEGVDLSGDHGAHHV